MTDISESEVMPIEAQKAVKELLSVIFGELRFSLLCEHYLDDASDMVPVPAHMSETFWHLLMTLQQRNMEYFREDPLCIFSDEMVTLFDNVAQTLCEEMDSVAVQYRGMYILLVSLSSLFLRELETGGIVMAPDEWTEYNLNHDALQEFVTEARPDILDALDHIPPSEMVSIDIDSVETSAGQTIQ